MVSDAFIAYVLELLGPFGTVGARRMFGGHGVYLDGLMFAIVSDDALYLKADEMNRIEFEQAGCEMFGYVRSGKRATLSFFRAPAEAMDSPDLMLPWARSAYAAALRAQAKKRVAARRRAVDEFTRAKSARAPAPAKKSPAARRPKKKAARRPSAPGKRK